MVCCIKLFRTLSHLVTIAVQIKSNLCLPFNWPPNKEANEVFKHKHKLVDHKANWIRVQSRVNYKPLLMTDWSQMQSWGIKQHSLFL